jgi:hypothetical protein
LPFGGLPRFRVLIAFESIRRRPDIPPFSATPQATFGHFAPLFGSIDLGFIPPMRKSFKIATEGKRQTSLACGPGPRAEKIAAAFGLTTVAAEAGNTSKLAVEFCRVDDAKRIWGLRRGLVYRKINDGTIRSIVSGKGGAVYAGRRELVTSEDET